MGTNFQVAINDGDRFNFSSFLLISLPINAREKCNFAACLFTSSFLLKNTFCSHKIWSVKLQSAQAEGTEYKHIRKQISKYLVTKKKETKEKSGIQNSLTEDKIYMGPTLLER